MAENKEESKVKSRLEAVKDIKNSLIQGNYDAAKSKKEVNLIEDQEFYSIVEKCYYELFKAKKFIQSIKLAEVFDLAYEKIHESAIQHYRVLLSKGKYEDAINWGLEYQLPINELQPSAVRAFEKFIKEGDIQKAIDIKNKFNLTKETVSNITINAFNRSFELGKYEIAALLGKEFQLSKKRTTIAAVKSLVSLINKGVYGKITLYEKWYNIFSDSAFELLDEKDIKLFSHSFIENFIKVALEKNDIDYIYEISYYSGIISGRLKNSHLVKIINKMYFELTNKHNQFLDQKNYAEAIKMKEKFELLGDINSPEMRKTIIEYAQQANKTLVEEENYKMALRIKDEYRLYEKNIIQNSMEFQNAVTTKILYSAFKKGNIAMAASVVKDYSVTKEFVKNKAISVIPELLKDEKYFEVFDIIDKLKINVRNNRVIELGEEFFGKAFKSKKYELASNIGYYFRIEKEKTRKAAFFAWQRKITRHDLDGALNIKKRFHLSSKITEDIAKKVYKELLAEGRTNDAKNLRKDYRLSMSLFEWIAELLGLRMRG